MSSSTRAPDVRSDGRRSATPLGPSPALVTANIKNSKTIDEVLANARKYMSFMNAISLAAFWHALGALVSRECTSEVVSDSTLALAAARTRTVASASVEVRARELATMAHGMVKSSLTTTTHGDVFDSISCALVKLGANACEAREAANVAWAFAKAGRGKGDETFDLITRVVISRAHAFNAQELANVMWALASVGRFDDDAFAAAARAGERLAPTMSGQGLTNIAWAFAKAGRNDQGLFRALVCASRTALKGFNAQDVSNCSWAFAKAGVYDAEFFAALGRRAEHHADGLNAQGLANTVWGFAKIGHVDNELFSALATRIRRKIGEFRPMDLANVAFAYSKACHLDECLFDDLARRAETCLEEHNTQDLVNTAYAFAKIGRFDRALFSKMAPAVAVRNLDELDAPQIATVAWAFAAAGAVDARLFSTLASSAARRVDELETGDLASIAWAFANADHMDNELFKSLVRSAERRIDAFNDEDLDNAEWAFSKAGHKSVANQLKQRRERTAGVAAALASADVDVSKCGTIVVAGGGIGGAAVAVALQSKGFDVVVLESDASFDARKQGYGLTIQGYSSTTQSLGISLATDDAPSTSHYTFDSEGRILGFFGEAFSASGKRERQECENSGRFIHIPRQVLRQRILERVQPNTVRWNCRLKEFLCWNDDDKRRSVGENGVTVTLSDGTSIDGALLVGSDGIFSTVRRRLDIPGDRLNYVGLVVVLGIVDDDVLQVPLTKRRIFETVDGVTRIYAMPFTTTSTMWQLSFPASEDEARRLSKDASTLKAEIVRRCSKWHDPIPELLRKTTLDCMSGYPVYDRELLEPDALRMSVGKGDTPEPQRRATLIGDAAHPMTPFKAQGANQALSDAVLLADTLVDNVRKFGPVLGFDAALPEFEKKMLSRSNKMVVGSRAKAKELHSALALRPARKAQRETGLDMTKIIRTLQSLGIGAQSAMDPNGLDAVVAEGMRAAAKEAPRTPAPQKRPAKDRGNDESDARAKLWGLVSEDDWRKCVLVKTKKSGAVKVRFDDGSTTTLSADRVQPRVKKLKNR